MKQAHLKIPLLLNLDLTGEVTVFSLQEQPLQQPNFPYPYGHGSRRKQGDQEASWNDTALMQSQSLCSQESYLGSVCLTVSTELTLIKM